MSIWIQVVQHLQPGGIETMALDLQRMEQQHERGLIVSLEGDKASALARWPRLIPYENRLLFLNKKPGWQPSVIAKLRDLFSQWGVQAVHTHHIGPLVYAGLAARWAGVPQLIHTEHDAWHLRSLKRRILQKVLLKLLNPALVADADLVAEQMKHYLGQPKLKVQVIKNGIDVHHFSPADQAQARRALGIEAEGPLIGNAGRMEQEKGQAVLIEAMRHMPPNCQLALAGDGSQRPALEQLAAQLGLSERVHFLGVVEDMPSFYSALDVFCLPSLYEGLSLVLLEAQACQVPTVATNVGASKEALCPQSGTLVEPGSAFSLAQALEQSLLQPAGANPRHFVKQSGDLRATSRNYSVLRQLYQI